MNMKENEPIKTETTLIGKILLKACLKTRLQPFISLLITGVKHGYFVKDTIDYKPPNDLNSRVLKQRIRERMQSEPYSEFIEKRDLDDIIDELTD